MEGDTSRPETWLKPFVCQRVVFRRGSKSQFQSGAARHGRGPPPGHFCAPRSPKDPAAPGAAPALFAAAAARPASAVPIPGRIVQFKNAKKQSWGSVMPGPGSGAGGGAGSGAEGSAGGGAGSGCGQGVRAAELCCPGGVTERLLPSSRRANTGVSYRGRAPRGASPRHPELPAGPRGQRSRDGSAEQQVERTARTEPQAERAGGSGATSGTNTRRSGDESAEQQTEGTTGGAGTGEAEHRAERTTGGAAATMVGRGAGLGKERGRSWSGAGQGAEPGKERNRARSGTGQGAGPDLERGRSRSRAGAGAGPLDYPSRQRSGAEGEGGEERGRGRSGWAAPGAVPGQGRVGGTGRGAVSAALAGVSCR